MERERALLLTCEHGGKRVPRPYARLFRGRQRLLASHRGWDPGALALARSLAVLTGAPLLAATTTRLLVDLNRSPHNPAVFSELTRVLPRAERELLLRRYHAPHWQRVRRAIRRAGRPVLHLAVHSFTAHWPGGGRDLDLGLLYDPARPAEARLAARWKRELGPRAGDLRVRRNAPYRGNADGLTTALRRELGGRSYLGIELEFNQALLARRGEPRRLAALLADLLGPPQGGKEADAGGRRAASQRGRRLSGRRA